MSVICLQLKNPFRYKKDSKNKDDDEETTEENADGNTTAPEPKKKKSFSGFTVPFPLKIKYLTWFFCPQRNIWT